MDRPVDHDEILTLDQLDLSSEGAWAAIDTGIVDEDLIGIHDPNAGCQSNDGFGLETIGDQLEQTSECFEASLLVNGRNDETTQKEEVVSIIEDPEVHEEKKEENEEEKHCRLWLQEQKDNRAKARHVDLDRRQAREQKEKLRKQQIEHAKKVEEERLKAASSKKGKKGKKTKKT